MPCRRTYLTGSPQRENIVGCGTHSGDAFVAKIQPGRQRQEHVMKKYYTEKEGNSDKITNNAFTPLTRAYRRTVQSHHSFKHKFLMSL